MLKIIYCYGFIPRYMLGVSIHSSPKIPAWFFHCHYTYINIYTHVDISTMLKVEIGIMQV